jgi:hypothetical protein
VIFLAEFSGRFTSGFLLGVTYGDLVPLWLATLPENSLESTSSWWFFRVARVLDLEA